MTLFIAERAALHGTLDMCIDKWPLYLGVRNSEPDVRLRVCDLKIMLITY